MAFIIYSIITRRRRKYTNRREVDRWREREREKIEVRERKRKRETIGEN